MNKEKGGFAFPHFFTNESIGDCSGMSLRDYFAAKASDEDVREIRYRKENIIHNDNGGIEFLITRQQARFIHADAMLAEREK